jgi:endoglucanase
MTTDRRAYKIDPSNPGSDLAGETAAAMAAASVVFRRSNPAYANKLITHAQQVPTNLSPSLLLSLCSF